MTLLQRPLDDAIQRSADYLKQNGISGDVDALYSMATGVGFLPAGLEDGERIELASVPGVPEFWRESTLLYGTVNGCSILLIEDPTGDPPNDEREAGAEPAWVRGFPSWLAASLGAYFCVQVSAGVALPREGENLRGALGLVTDHINLSGRTPLLGLGESHLGPLFPDVSELHHEGLRQRAAGIAERLGVRAEKVIAACTLGPALTTPAERVFLSRSGADVACQGLESALLSCGHAGLSMLSIVAITDAGESGGVDVKQIVEDTVKLAPAIDDLLLALSEDVGTMARELRECE